MTDLKPRSRRAPEHPHAQVDPSAGHARLRVMCATDLWGRSDRALQKALWLAEAADSKLLLLHVVEGETPLRIAGRRADHARGALEWHVRGWPTQKPRPAVSVRVGNPHRIISDVARQWRADLVVLGTARSRLADRFVATAAERLALDAGSAVLVVNRGMPDAYEDAAILATSCQQASTIENLLRRLQIVERSSMVLRLHPSAAPRTTRPSRGFACESIRAWSELRRATADMQTAARALLDAPPDLLVAMVDRWPALFRLSRRSVTSMIAQCATTDVLIVPFHETRSETAEPCHPHLHAVP